MKGNLQVGNIADNLNYSEEFAVTAWGLRDHFTTFMKRYKSKTRREVKGNNFLKTQHRFEESERRTEADTQKRCLLYKINKSISSAKSGNPSLATTASLDFGFALA